MRLLADNNFPIKTMTTWQKFSQIPLHPICFAIYPSLAYLAWNIHEVDPRLVVRPMLASLFLGTIFFGLINLAIKQNAKSALLATITLTFFFSYGHVENILRKTYILANKNVWHILLTFVTLLLLTGMFFLFQRYVKDVQPFTLTLNLVGVIILVSPIYTIVTKQATPQTSIEQKAPSMQTEALPDIYYIILDGYSRHDTLDALGYDNSAFRSELEEMGFYIASCSRSNYRTTLLSLTSTLNMDYLYEFIPHKGRKDTNLAPLYDALKNNRVRRELTEMGYKVVTFETGYRWLEWEDADIYMHMNENPFTAAWLHPFEYGFLKTTALDSLTNTSLLAKERFKSHYQRVQFVFEQLPETTSLPGPKFVYAHIIVPHAPFMFLPDGSINPDTRYYASEDGVGETEEINAVGYLNNVRYVDNIFPEVVGDILRNNQAPTVIVVQGDHGLIYENRKYNILNAYYFPGEHASEVYPTITPVNTFRFIFSQYLGKELPLLEDVSISTDIGRPYKDIVAPSFPETCP